jgi:hypothetical protein
MRNVANSRFAIKSWDEKPYSEGQDLPKLTRATMAKESYVVIPGSGTGELRGTEHPLTLTYELG